MGLMTDSLVARFPALAPIYAVQSAVHNCDEADRDLDHRLVLALLPGLAPAAPHCVGDEPIFFHDPLHKQRVPRMTESVDDCLRVAHIMKLSVTERGAVVAEAALHLKLLGVPERAAFGAALARYISRCLIEYRIYQHHSDPEAYAKIDFS